MDSKSKYLKYKTKYLSLQKGGAVQWQYKNVDKWVDYDSLSNSLIEELFQQKDLQPLLADLVIRRKEYIVDFVNMTIQKRNIHTEKPIVVSIRRNTDDWEPIRLSEHRTNTTSVKSASSQDIIPENVWFKLVLTNPRKHNYNKEHEEASAEIEKCIKSGRSEYIFGGINYTIEFKKDVWFNTNCDAVKINKRTYEITPLVRYGSSKHMYLTE